MNDTKSSYAPAHLLAKHPMPSGFVKGCFNQDVLINKGAIASKLSNLVFFYCFYKITVMLFAIIDDFIIL